MIRTEPDLIWSDASSRTARRVEDSWTLSWMPARVVDESAAQWAMDLADRKPAQFSEIDLGGFCALAIWQVRRARDTGLITEPDGTGADGQRYWLAATAEAIAADSARIATETGSIPDIGAYRAAGELTRRLGFTITADAVVELARRGQLPTADEYKGHTLYSGRAIEAFDDAVAAASAAVDGHMLTDTEAAAFLDLRASDFRHLVRANIARPVPWRDCLRSAVPWRTGDLAAIEAAHPEIDWAAVRATPKGRRSPLASVPTLPQPSD